MIATRADRFLSEEDSDLRNLTEEELVAWWNLWLNQAQATNELDRDEYAHGVFRQGPRPGAAGRPTPDAAAGRESSTLARRLGVTTHVSPLRFRLERLRREHPSPGAPCLEDWLLDVANARGARFVTRRPPAAPDFIPPPPEAFSNEELVVAICQPHNLDRPQMLRAAAQLISMQAVDARALLAAARRERVEPVLAELARQALRVAPEHSLWRALAAGLAHIPAPRDPILHWTRLAVPMPDARGCNAKAWILIA